MLEDLWAQAGARLQDDVELVLLRPYYRICFADGRRLDYGGAPEQVEAQLRADVHVAAAVDQLGRLLGTSTVPTTPGGYAALRRWARQFGMLEAFGIEGTSSYGAGLARWLGGRGRTARLWGLRVVEP